MVPIADDPPDADEGGGLLLDDWGERLNSFYSLRKSSSAEAEETLAELGASDQVDRQILLELGAPKPLFRPDRFLQAHTLMVRSLEVLDRNGTRNPPLPNLGPLKPVLAYPVEVATKYVVRSHLRGVTDSVHKLYVRREANCLPDDPARALLRRGRADMERISPDFRRNPLAIPGFIVGGAFLSTILGLLQDTVGLFGGSAANRIVATVVFVLVAFLGAYVLIKGAAVAHRRIDMTTDKPVAALYETVGRAGKPPNDQSGTFAVISIVLLTFALVLIPIGFALTVSV